MFSIILFSIKFCTLIVNETSKLASKFITAFPAIFVTSKIFGTINGSINKCNVAFAHTAGIPPLTE